MTEGERQFIEGEAWNNRPGRARAYALGVLHVLAGLVLFFLGLVWLFTGPGAVFIVVAIAWLGCSCCLFVGVDAMRDNARVDSTFQLRRENAETASRVRSREHDEMLRREGLLIA